ncbi:acyl-CoA dehydrogenase family protein [candidate division WOR-3 bacterium]|nr:acyl-CoA dehydrogenase family protein [candidate division WOR-3 bacterium]
MDWMGLKEEHKLLRQDMKRFAETEIAPQVSDMDKTGEPQIASLKKFGEIGGLGILVSEEFEGAGMDLLSLVITVEELAKVSPSFALSVSAHNIVCNIILSNGSTELKKEYLPALATGRVIAGMGVDTMIHPISSGATEEKLIVNGSFSDIFGFVVKNDGKEKFIVIKNDKGLKEEKEMMGMRTSGICSFKPAEGTIKGNGFTIDSPGNYYSLMRILFAAIACGISQSSFEYSRSYSKERYQFERPIASFGMIRIILADMVSRSNASRLLVYQASSSTNIIDKEIATVFATENSLYVTDKGVQVYGGYGYIKDYPLEMFFRDAKVLEVFSGSADYRKVLIGKQLTS